MISFRICGELPTFKPPVTDGTRVTVTLRAEARPGQGPVRHRSIRATFTVAELRQAIETGRAAWGEGERADVEAMISVEPRPGPEPGEGQEKPPRKTAPPGVIVV